MQVYKATLGGWWGTGTPGSRGAPWGKSSAAFLGEVPPARAGMKVIRAQKGPSEVATVCRCHLRGLAVPGHFNVEKTG